MPGDYYLLFSHSSSLPGFTFDWIPEWYNGSLSVAAATPITITSYGEIAPLSIQLREGTSLPFEIVINELANDYLVCTAFLTPHDFEANWIDAQLSCETGESPDYYSFPFIAKGLPPGKYKVGGLLEQFTSYQIPKTVWYPGTTDWDSATVITIIENEPVPALKFAIPLSSYQANK